jgi:endonuclease YncB( thermonuclease family)
VSRHWKPEIVAPDWTRQPYRRSGAGKVVLVLAGAVAVGLGAAFLLNRHNAPVDARPDAPIEWNAVQKVPTRPLSPDEVEWEKRAQDPAVIASPEGARQSSQSEEASPEGGLPRGSAARNDLYVIDGDTVALGRERIRTLGIDAPETHPPRCAREAELGTAATLKLRELLGSGTVTISGTGQDRYGRELRTVRVNGQDVGEAMIGAGLARSYAGGKRFPWC